jgi:hypothetical protein
MSSGGGDIPNPPDYAKLYQSGLDVYLRNLPRVTDTETQYREAIDPLRIAEQQALQDQYGPNQIRQQREALDQFDPNYLNTRELLRTNVTNDLLRGTQLDPDYARQLEQGVRGAQTARGNVYGTAPAAAEASVKGKAALDLYQQRLTNVGNFLAGPTPEQQALAIQAVQPDRGMAYASPAAGTQGANFGLSNYQNLLAQQQLVGSQRNPWSQAAGGAASGALAGSALGPWGAVAGGLIGGAAGYFGSDENIKERITDTGDTHRGIRVVEFNYKWSPRRLRGVIAQEVEKLFPELVKTVNGVKFVDYDSLGLQMELV